MNKNSYQAVLIVSFGGPEGMEDVIPFLENVLKGRNVPRERMLEVAHHYEQFNGISPINEQNRQLMKALQAGLEARGISLPVFLGNRNWYPFLGDSLRSMYEKGIQNVLAFFTSPYSSYSGCRQYREDIARALDQNGLTRMKVDKIRAYYNHPGFIETGVDRVRTAFEQLAESRRRQARLVFSAHSIPVAMASACRYESQLFEACHLVAQGTGISSWDLVYQSRSGPPSQPWLEPDVGDWLKKLKCEEIDDVVLYPIGFISDHMEVLYDLDTEAREICEQIGLNMVRAGTAGTHAAFVEMALELIEERLDQTRERKSLGKYGPGPDFCPEGCCLPEGRRERS